MENRTIQLLDKTEKELNVIKKQSDLRSKYLTFVEEVLQYNDIKSFAKNKKIRKLELEIEKNKNN